MILIWSGSYYTTTPTIFIQINILINLIFIV